MKRRVGYRDERDEKQKGGVRVEREEIGKEGNGSVINKQGTGYAYLQPLQASQHNIK